MPLAIAILGDQHSALAEAVSRVDPSLLITDDIHQPVDLVLFTLDPRSTDPLHQLSDRELARCFERQPGGFPVGFILTSCDTLLERGDTVSEWLQRVDRHRQQLSQAVRSQLTAFGRVEPFVAATAFRSPAMAGSPVDQTGGLGIVDLVHQIHERAKRHTKIASRSQRRLITLVAIAIKAIVLMALLTVTLIAWAGPLKDDRLTAQIRSYQAREKPTAVRLSEARRPRVKAELQAIREDVAYSILNPDLRDFIEDRWQELERYDAYAKRFRPPQLSAGECRSREELDQLAKELRDRLAPPSDDAEAWGETEMLRLRQKWAIEIDALREAESTLANGFAEQSQRLNRLILTSTFDRPWSDESRLASQAEPVTLRAESPLPGSFELPVVGGEALTYATAFEFDRVDAARREWESSRERLNRLRELVALLGLIGSAEDAWLDSTSPAADRLAAIRARHPALLDSPLAYAVPNWGDPNRELIRSRLERSLDRLTTATQTRIRSDIGLESAVAWKTWSETARDRYRAESELLVLLETLRSGQVPTVAPIDALIDTMTKPRVISLTAFVITMPEAATSLTWTIGEKAIEWKRRDEPTLSNGQWTTRFEPSQPSVTVIPGQPFIAKMTITRAGQSVVCDWDRGHSTVVPYDRFRYQPLLLEPGQKPIRANGVIVRLEPENAWSITPALLPDFGANAK